MGKLFKYRVRNKYTDAIFTTGCLHFSHRYDFNDPYDCLLLTDPHESLKYLCAPTRIDAPNQFYSLEFDGRLIRTAYQKVFDQLEICCFSIDGCQMQMWSHYANYHKGICLEFDEDLLRNDNMRGYKVNYTSEQIKYNTFFPEEFSAEHLKFLYTKHESWAYEKEVRIFHKTIEGSQGNYPFDKKALTGICFGAKCSMRTISHYIRLCLENGFDHVKFYMMGITDQGHYELMPRLLKPDK